MSDLNKTISPDKFNFVNQDEIIRDKVFEDKPIGYFKDAWIRFKKSRASVAGLIIIILIVIYAIITPLLITTHDATFLAPAYAKKAPRHTLLRPIGIATGGVKRNFSEKGLVSAVATGVGALDHEGTGKVTIKEGLESDFQPMLKIGEPFIVKDGRGKDQTYYKGTIDAYLEVGFRYLSIEQHELEKMRAWEAETGLNLLYPLIENNEYCVDPNDANAWYKTVKNGPVKVNNGNTKSLKYAEDTVLEDNYKRDSNGSPVYYEFTGGGSIETAQYKVRVLYYNYFQYLYGYEPNYILGTDAQGYDLAIRLADGIKLSLVLAVIVSIINFIIGAGYGAIEGYYGGAVDITLERISDILAGVPFIVVATLFQIHLGKKVGVIPSLIFAFILTGWIGTAYRVRTQFYRFKNQEYVMAARTLGAKDKRIIWKHIFPNTLGTIITSSALAIPGVIGTESMLSFLGIVKLSTTKVTSLGNILADAQGIWTNYPHLMICPAVVISLLMISFNLFGNGLRDAFNPSLRGVEE